MKIRTHTHVHEQVAHVAQYGNGESRDLLLGNCDKMSVHTFVHTYIYSHTHSYTYIFTHTCINGWRMWRSAGMAKL